MNPDIHARFLELRDNITAVCESLRHEAGKLNLGSSIDPDYTRANFKLSRDPASGGQTLVGIWRDNNGMKQGEILFHADGSFFAEYDVICNHPNDKRWFVEAVSAWGKDNDIRSEARLLPMQA